jgi:hypothetical protein
VLNADQREFVAVISATATVANSPERVSRTRVTMRNINSLVDLC